jgi:hypothetical protein
MNDDAEWEDWSRRWHRMPVSAGSLEDRTGISRRPRKPLSVVMIVLLLAGVAWETFLEHSTGWALVWLVVPLAWVTSRRLAWKAAATAGEMTVVYAKAIAGWSGAGMAISVLAVTASIAIASRWIYHLSRSIHGGASSLAEDGLLLAVAICSIVLFSRDVLESVRVLRFIAVLKHETKACNGEAGPRAIWSARPGGFRLGGRRRRSSKKGAI